MSFIVTDNLSNINSLVNTFQEEGLINVDKNMLKCKEYHKSCIVTMEKVREKCHNKTMFGDLLSAANHISDTFDPCIIPNLLSQAPEMQDLVHDAEETKIAKRVRREVESTMGDDYFDRSINDTMNAFSNLFEELATKPLRSTRSTLKVVSNCHVYEPLLVQDYLSDMPTMTILSESTYWTYYLTDISWN
jgi:hypothetical protein